MAKQKKKSALQEKKGIQDPKVTNAQAIKQLRQKRQQEPSTDALVAGILKQDLSALSRAITLVESTQNTHTQKANNILKACLAHSNNSIRIGITGVPGVGKSTFIEAFGLYLTGLGNKVAVLAVDPSSSLTKGSILGDKTRMALLANNPNAYIRPSASGTSLGGVARKTRESMVLCEAAGFNIIIIETVGVGQNETAVHSMVDFFLLLKIAGAGDELQGIKRGIIEMADAIAINKADGDNIKPAKRAQQEFKRALQLYPEKASGWIPKVLLCSAIEQTGIKAIWQLVEQHISLTTHNGTLQTKRDAQNKFWLLQTIESQLKQHFYSNPKVKEALEKQLELIKTQQTTPFAAAEYLLGL